MLAKKTFICVENQASQAYNISLKLYLFSSQIVLGSWDCSKYLQGWTRSQAAASLQDRFLRDDAKTFQGMWGYSKVLIALQLLEQ